MATNDYIENTVPAVKFSKAVLTKYPVTSTSTSASSFSGPVTVNGLTNTGKTVGNLKTITTLAATAAPTAAQSGTLFLMAPPSGVGFTTTLPVPVVGCEFSFLFTISVASGTQKIITDAGTTLLQGAYTSATTTASVFESVIGSSNIAFNMNGTTTGGLVGTYLTFVCLSATLWNVSGVNFTSSTTGTAFATS